MPRWRIDKLLAIESNQKDMVENKQYKGVGNFPASVDDVSAGVEDVPVSNDDVSACAENNSTSVEYVSHLQMVILMMMMMMMLSKLKRAMR